MIHNKNKFKYIILVIMGLALLSGIVLGSIFFIKERKKSDVFVNANNNSVLIFEPLDFHGECLPTWVKYFNTMGYHVDLMITPKMAKDMPLVRLPKNSDYSIIEVLPKDRVKILENKKILNYKHILVSSSWAFDSDYHSILHEFKILNNHPSLHIVEHSLRNIDRMDEQSFLDKNRLITLWDFKKGIMVNPSDFGNVQITPKNVTTFIVVGTHRKDFQTLFNAAEKLLEKTENFHIIIVGKFFPQKYSIPEKIKPFITFTGRINYPQVYYLMERADFYLPLWDKNIHKTFLKDGRVSGSLQLILGFKKIPIMQKEWAELYKFDNKNSLTYNSNNLAPEMLKAIKMSPKTYREYQRHLHEKAADIQRKSWFNFKKMFKK